MFSMVKMQEAKRIGEVVFTARADGAYKYQGNQHGTSEAFKIEDVVVPIFAG